MSTSSAGAPAGAPYASAAGPPPPGPLAEEAVRLLEAVQDWTRAHAGPVLGAAGAALGDAQVGHSAACRVCPVCQVVATVSRPETWTHLADAASSLAAALRSAVAAAGAAAAEADGAGAAGPAAPGVEHIDISGE